MPRKLVKTTDITREQWLEYRRTGLGGSDAAVVMGLTPYRSKIELWADKTGACRKPRTTRQCAPGAIWSSTLQNGFCEAAGKKVRRRNYIFQHDEYDFITANVDREIIGENAGLECKTTSAFTKADFDSGEIPLYYYCQCCHYMNVMGYDRMYLAVLIGGQRFRWFTIERNDSECAALLRSEIAFWNDCIKPDIRPEPDGSESAEHTLKALYPDWQDNAIAMFEQNDAAAELAAVMAQKKELETREKALKQKLQTALDGNTDGLTVDWHISYKPQSRSTVDSKRLKAERPDIYSEYLRKPKR